MDLHQHIGRKIRDLRRQQHLTLEQMSECLHVSYQQIQKYERGVSKIPLEKLVSIAHVLKVPATYFFEKIIPEAEVNARVDLPEEQPSMAERPLTLWLVESDPVDEFMMRQLLKEIDDQLTIFCVHSAAQMAQVLTRDYLNPLFAQPDLLFLDMTVSKQDNHAIVSTLRDRLFNTPILVLAYHVQRRDLNRVLRNGANSVVLKSTQSETLKRTLATMIHYWSHVAILPSRD